MDVDKTTSADNWIAVQPTQAVRGTKHVTQCDKNFCPFYTPLQLLFQKLCVFQAARDRRQCGPVHIDSNFPLNCLKQVLFSNSSMSHRLKPAPQGTHGRHWRGRFLSCKLHREWTESQTHMRREFIRKVNYGSGLPGLQLTWSYSASLFSGAPRSTFAQTAKVSLPGGSEQFLANPSLACGFMIQRSGTRRASSPVCLLLSCSL